MSERKGSLRSLWPLWALLAVAAVSVGLACNTDGGTEPTVVITFASPTPTSPPLPTPSPTASPTPSPTPVSDVCGVNPDPAPTSLLQVQEPEPNERVDNPIHIRGWGSEIAKDNRGVVVALIDANGDPLPVEGDSTSKKVAPESRAGRIAAPGIAITDYTAPFATDILVQGLRAPTPFCVWVFLATTEEGVPTQVVQVPITIVL